MTSRQYINVSLSIQQLATMIDDHLKQVAGERIAFALVIHVDGTAQYTGNCSRADGTVMIEDLLTRWKANRADIPAHYNPDIRRPA